MMNKNTGLTKSNLQLTTKFAMKCIAVSLALAQLTGCYEDRSPNQSATIYDVEAIVSDANLSPE
jgi:hypothetical protein